MVLFDRDRAEEDRGEKLTLRISLETIKGKARKFCEGVRTKIKINSRRPVKASKSFLEKLRIIKILKIRIKIALEKIPRLASKINFNTSIKSKNLIS